MLLPTFIGIQFCRKCFPRRVLKLHINFWVSEFAEANDVISEIIHKEPVVFPIYITAMSYVSYLWSLKLTNPEMLLLPKSKDGECGDVGWIGIEVANEIAAIT